MKQLFFISGLPRSLSTTLCAILSQNSSITVTPTSPMLDLLCYTNEAFEKLLDRKGIDRKSVV